MGGSRPRPRTPAGHTSGRGGAGQTLGVRVTPTPISPRQAAPAQKDVAENRVRFLTAEVPRPRTVRDTILASWRRSLDMRVAADKIEMRFEPDMHLDTRLSRSAQPVLRSLSEQLQGQSVSVILTDQSGLVLSRLTGDGELERHLDRVLLAPGFSYAEEFVGTNGIGTALEVRRTDPRLRARALCGEPRGSRVRRSAHPPSRHWAAGGRRGPHLLAPGCWFAAADAGEDHRRPDRPGAARRRERLPAGALPGVPPHVQPQNRDRVRPRTATWS